MNLPFTNMFAKPAREETAQMRDELIRLRTMVVFAERHMADLARHRREPRSDKASIRAAKEAMTKRLQDEANRAMFRRLEPKMFAGMGKGSVQ